MNAPYCHDNHIWLQKIWHQKILMKVKNTNNSSPDGCFSATYTMPPSVYINIVHESEKYQEL